MCGHCVDDYALKRFIEEHTTARECSFCHRKGIAIDAEVLKDVIFDGISSEYEEATAPYDKDVDYDIFNLIFDEHLGISSRPTFLRWLLKSVGGGHRWHDRVKPVDGLCEGWDDFKEAVKFYSRFLLFDGNVRQALTDEPAPPYYVHPGQVLDRIGKLFTTIDLTLRLPPGTQIFRARVHSIEEAFTTPEELGPPPVENCRPGRMNAAGIVVFYGAKEEDTAIRETRTGNAAVSVGTFELLRSVVVLDLVKIGEPPSIFDEQERSLREPLEFLSQFRNDIAQPVCPDDNGVDYIPTQVVSEFLRHRFTDKYGNRVDGILYPSVQRPGGRNLVLFVTRAGIEGIETESYGHTSKLLRLKTAKTLGGPWIRENYAHDGSRHGYPSYDNVRARLSSPHFTIPAE